MEAVSAVAALVAQHRRDHRVGAQPVGVVRVEEKRTRVAERREGAPLRLDVLLLRSRAARALGRGAAQWRVPADGERGWRRTRAPQLYGRGRGSAASCAGVSTPALKHALTPPVLGPREVFNAAPGGVECHTNVAPASASAPARRVSARSRRAKVATASAR